MHQMSPEMQSCIDECQRCHSVCLGMAMNHCLEAGGRHVEPKHFRLMIACAEICQTSANFMLIGTDHHKRTCAVCAEVCEECARSCEQVGDMQDCVDACRRCAESCRKMAA
ncbi:four-helix bundle copper-binding protein [Paracoccus shandongensis]|uniref:four-helix bundle copper-binding protein n=1 Tax=Paracoccus shandongensis TaxID=2816048 RepID=UPI001A8D5E6E|nr:four-helix bundle copper-binding protein [Paracoccus shandongensis]